MIEYNFKLVQEIGWSVLVAVVVFVCTAVIGTNEATDWSAWGSALLGGTARAAAGAVLAIYTSKKLNKQPS